MPFISRNVIQDEVRLGVTAVRDSAVKVFAAAAAAAAAAVGLASGDFPALALERILALQLGKTVAVYQDRDHLDGFVLVFLELAKFPVLRPLLRRLDVPAFLAHIYLNARSTAPDFSETGAYLSEATGERLPKLGPNQKRSNVNIYAAPIHDFKLLLRALTQGVVRAGD